MPDSTALNATNRAAVAEAMSEIARLGPIELRAKREQVLEYYEKRAEELEEKEAKKSKITSK